MQTLLENFSHPPVLFFFLGVLAVLVRSDLEIPPAIAKFLGIYLLFHIGIKGGEELYHSYHDVHPAATGQTSMLVIILLCVAASFVIPFLSFRILRLRLDAYNAGAIAACYGSISAVTFATASNFLQTANVKFGGYMVAAMAMMEAPAIVAGLILIRQHTKQDLPRGEGGPAAHNFSKVLHEAFFNGSVFLLMGSLAIGFLGGKVGEEELKPFVDDIFKGMLCLYMLEMGLLAARRLSELRQSGWFLIAFSLFYPPLVGSLGLGLAYALGLSVGDALLMTILFASASYIAVPAAMRLSVPQANLSLMLPMTLGLTFTFNITIGIPAYFALIQYFW